MRASDRFYIISDQLLLNPRFEDLGYWPSTGRGSTQVVNDALILKTYSTNAKQEVRQHLNLPPGHYQIYVELYASLLEKNNSTDIPPFSVGLITRDSHGNRTGRIGALNLEKMDLWHIHSKKFTLKNNVNIVELQLRLRLAHGELKMRNPMVSSLAEHKSFRILRTFLIITLLLLAISLLSQFLSIKNLTQLKQSNLVWSLYMPIVTFTVIAILGLSLPPDIVKPMLNNVIKYSMGSELLEGTTSALAHFFIFGVIGCVFGCNYKRIGVIFPFFFIFTLSIFTESIQTFTNNRTASYSDASIDIVGAVVGLIAGVVTTELISRIFNTSSHDA